MSVNYDSKKFYNIGYRPPSETQDRKFCVVKSQSKLLGFPELS
jgi:hypothetical protein